MVTMLGQVAVASYCKHPVSCCSSKFSFSWLERDLDGDKILSMGYPNQYRVETSFTELESKKVCLRREWIKFFWGEMNWDIIIFKLVSVDVDTKKMIDGTIKHSFYLFPEKSFKVLFNFRGWTDVHEITNI